MPRLCEKCARKTRGKQDFCDDCLVKIYLERRKSQKKEGLDKHI